MELSTLELLPGKEASVKRGHPWVFSGALRSKPTHSGWARLLDHNGRFQALGIAETGSIAFKMASFDEVTPEAHLEHAVTRALKMRQELGLWDSPHTQMHRLVFAEGDALPGLVVDRYGDHLVVQLHSMAWYALREALTEILVRQTGIPNVYFKTRESLHQPDLEEGYVSGQGRAEVFLEHGIRFKVDWETGQKTGFFLDQRESRALVGQRCAGARVLNIFSYTGGFSMYALAGGATEVWSIDSSKKALVLADENAALNGFADRHRSVAEDAFAFLGHLPEGFDRIVLDPPAFAKNRHSTHNATQAYRRINRMAIEGIEPGGELFTFSCSQHIDRPLFESIVRSAAIDARRRVVVLGHHTQPPDHPFDVQHPEGEYLKGLWVRVL
ncbi:class I SAM-dependent rRNA methyltransferase [bacterium]|nr:class I SAM-dependent rRNA methyltransferase [bacterium]